MNEMSGAPFDRDPLDPAGLTDLPSFYRELRDHCPAYYYEDYDTFFFSRFQDVWDILRIGDNALVASETNLPTREYLRSHRNTGTPPPMASINPLGPLAALPSPWYEEMRGAHIAPLKPKAVLNLADFIRKVTRERLEALLKLGRFDMVMDFAGFVVANSICRLFGLPPERALSLFNEVNAATQPDENSTVDFAKFFAQVKGYIVPCIQARRNAGADGENQLIDGLVNYRMPDGRALSDSEIADQLVCIMVGGLESASKVSATGIMELWRNPDQLAEVRADLETNIPIAVDEMVRHGAPAQYTFRTAYKDLTVAGAHIRPGQRICAMIWSAAHDEREFDQAERFIWNRQPLRTISFGVGQHHCIGKHLALLEVRIIVEEFLKRVDRFSFDMDNARRNPSYFQHGWIRLPIIIE